MSRSARLVPLAFALLSLFLVSLLAWPRAARADSPAGTGAAIYVLDVQSDGTADDQAKALTTAMKSRVRAAPEWQLKEADHSFETFRLTLKCPIGQKPDAACLQRIADNIQEAGAAKADRYVWGEMAHQGATEVTVTVHLWQRNKPDVATTETYSDNLKDETDEALRTIAERIFSKLTGNKQTGTITVHAGTAAGAVFVDGVQLATLDQGAAKLEVPTGSHSIEVRVAGYASPAQTVNVLPAAEQELTFTLTPQKPDVTPTADLGTSKVPVRKIVGWTAIGLGVVSIGVGVYEATHFLSLKSDLDNDRNSIPNTVTDVCQDLATPASVDACQKFKDARSARVLEYVFLAAGAVLVGGGVVLLVTDPGTHSTATTTGAHVRPHVGPHTAGLDLSVTF